MRTEPRAGRTRVALLGVRTLVSAALMTTVTTAPAVAEWAALDGWPDVDTESLGGIFT